MFDLILLLVLGAILLFVFSSSVRAWALSWFLQRIQRQMQRQMEEQMRAQGGPRGSRGQGTSGQQGRQSAEEHRPHASGKLDMGDIEAKKFDTPRSEDYVDFEELPK